VTVQVAYKPMARELLIRDNSSGIITNDTWITDSWQFKWHIN